MKSFTTEFKMQVIQECRDTGNVAVVCKKHDLRSSTVHGWIKKDANKENTMANQELRALKRKLADRELEVLVLKSLLKKTYQVWSSEDGSSPK